jgi:hypothetical protein
MEGIVHDMNAIVGGSHANGKTDPTETQNSKNGSTFTKLRGLISRNNRWEAPLNSRPKERGEVAAIPSEDISDTHRE